MPENLNRDISSILQNFFFSFAWYQKQVKNLKIQCNFVDIECPKCLHMETTSYLGSFVKLPSNKNCSSESQSGNIKTRKCPTQTSDDKMFLCGNMGGNLTVKLYSKWKVYFSAFYPMNLKAVWYMFELI